MHVEVGDGGFGQVPFGVGPLEADPNANIAEDEISRWQKASASGAAAEMLLFGRYRDYGCSNDRAQHERLEKRRSTARNNGWDEDVQSTLDILDEESVLTVARRLLRDRNLSDETVYELLGTPAPWDVD
jgi:hypothetical protein